MAISPESMPEYCFDFRAPPPSPIATGRKSSFANDEVINDFLEHSLKVPHLILPDKVFPVQKFINNVPKFDLQSINSIENESIPKILDSLATVGCFQLVNYGIPNEVIKCMMDTSAGIFQVSPEKRLAAMRSRGSPFGYEDVNGEEENELSEEFVWCSDENLKLVMDGICPIGFSKFSEKMEVFMSDINKIAEKVLQVIEQNRHENASVGEVNKRMKQGSNSEKLGDCVCYIYKHKNNVSNDGLVSSLRYDVIRMLIGGIDDSHALCLHICDGSSEFHVYSKKGWVSFCPDKHSLLITIGDQIQEWSGGQYKHVIGRPIYKGEKNDCISMAFLYTPPTIATLSVQEKRKTISIGQQAIFALILTFLYQFLVYIFYEV